MLTDLGLDLMFAVARVAYFLGSLSWSDAWGLLIVSMCVAYLVFTTGGLVYMLASILRAAAKSLRADRAYRARLTEPLPGSEHF